MKSEFKRQTEIVAPILLIVFNRPDTTLQVFNAIRKARPKKLYVSADAPRNGNITDQINCKKVRELVKNVDWECEVNYRFLEENLGCGYGPESAITWAFENEDRLIILEDDCVPSIPFFDFCNNMLEKYYSYKNIYLISGRSHHSNHSAFKDSDYLFSRYGHTWGWATWKRVWNKFDINMQGLDYYLKNGGFKDVFNTELEIKYFNEFFEKILLENNLTSHVWDYQFVYLRLKDNSLSIVPKENLIRNIGHLGTHGSGDSSNSSYTLKASESFAFVKHPSKIELNLEYEKYHFLNHINKKNKLLPVRVFKKILSYLPWLHLFKIG